MSKYGEHLLTPMSRWRHSSGKTYTVLGGSTCATNGPGEGQHVEMGAALALCRRVVVVGFRENLFCWHPAVEFFATVDELFTVAFPNHKDLP